MAVSEATFRQLSLEDDDAVWELVCGRLREKPAMTHEHGGVATYLAVLLTAALPRSRFRVAVNHARLRLPDGQYFVPDVAVLPAQLFEPRRRQPHMLDEYAAPLPLVAEVWSPSTGGYDARDKLDGYQRRRDEEVWLIDPYALVLRAYRRQPDGSYQARDYGGGDIVEPASLPGVAIALSELFS